MSCFVRFQNIFNYHLLFFMVKALKNGLCDNLSHLESILTSEANIQKMLRVKLAEVKVKTADV